MNQRPLQLCLSVPNLITRGAIGHILDYGHSVLQLWEERYFLGEGGTFLGKGYFFWGMGYFLGEILKAGIHLEQEQTYNIQEIGIWKKDTGSCFRFLTPKNH